MKFDMRTHVRWVHFFVKLALMRSGPASGDEVLSLDELERAVDLFSILIELLWPAKDDNDRGDDKV